MTNYTKATNFAAKDSLASGNAAKVVKGTEIDTEFTNIETAVNSKSDSANPVFTGVAEFADGSASAPSITNTGDTNTGIFFPAADTVGITTGGTEMARVDSSGNLGLGVTPSAWGGAYKVNQILNAAFVGTGNRAYMSANYYDNGTNDKYITSDYATRYLQLNGTHRWENAASGTAGNAITFTQAMTLDASGNLALGQTTALSGGGAARWLTLGTGGGTSYSGGIAYAINGTLNAYHYVDTDGLLAHQVVTNNGQKFLTNNTERARIDSSGNLLVGTTDSGLTTGAGVKIASNIGASTVSSLSTNSNSCLHMYSTGAGAYRFYVGWGGTVYATSTTISAISDIRFKENVRDLDAGLAEVMALKPRLYDWKEGKGADIKNARGFIAQEFEQVFPDLIDEWKDPAPEGEEPYKSVRQDLIPVLVKAIQELKAIVDAQAAEIAALKG